MCGIVGIVDQRGGASREDLSRARDAIAHRGPDDAGLWVSDDGVVGLGHCRLSIIDLRSEGRQPMMDARGRAVIVFNGEIYNYLELRKELELAGEVFRTRTDTEVLLISYLVWGHECVRRLNGMWSFAIWDLRRRELFLSRDRVGKKPLYFSHANGRLTFASQLKSLLEFSGTSFSVDHDALNAYLALGYIPGELSLLQSARKLPPAHSGVYNPVSGELRTWRYWDLPSSASGDCMVGEKALRQDDLVDRLEFLLRDAVAKRLEADVPVGLLLSGGVDSSIIAALAADIKGRSGIRTFTIKMLDARLDESARARRVADFLGTEHIELPADLGTLDLLPEAAEYCDEPIGDSSLLPTLILSRLTRQHVTVALGGDGGDEVFGGYGHYVRAVRYAWVQRYVPNPVFGMVSELASRLLPPGRKGRGLLLSLRHGPAAMSVYGTPYFDAHLRAKLLAPEIVEELGGRFSAPEIAIEDLAAGNGSLLSGLMARDFKGHMVEDILVKVDRASMGEALEVRCPWLDTHVVEFAFRDVPDALKVTESRRKILPTALAERLLPGQIGLQRKQGFSIPLWSWFQDKGVMSRVKTWIYDSPLREMVREKVVDKLIAGQCQGRSNAERLYALALLGICLSRYGKRLHR